MPATATAPNTEIWFLTGSQTLYGEETLRQVASQSRRIADALQAASSVPVKVVWKPVLTEPDAIRRTILEANADDGVIGLIAWMHTFSPAKMWIAGLNALDKPLLHLHTQGNVALPWSGIDMDFMNLNQAAHGDREFGYILTRLGVRRKTVAGHVSDPRVQEKVGTWARAAAGWAATRSLRLARFGDNMRYVAVTEGDKTEAETVFGVAVNTWGVNDLAGAVDAASDAEIDGLIAEYEDLYDIAPELRPGGERHASLRYGAATEIGLRSFLAEGGFAAFTTNFEDLGGLKQLPGLSVQRLMADGYGFGAEGDWKTAVLVRAAKVMGAGLPGGASLMEDYTYDLTPGKEVILGAHMLEVCPSLTASRPRLEIHPLAIGGREDPVRLVFTADPGPGVVVALTDMRDRFRLVANAVELVPPAEPLPRLPVGRAVWRPEPDFGTSTASWLAAGAAHHTAMSTAAGLEAFEDFARMAGVELLVIDSGTTVSGFEQQIRANAAYYRLARGILAGGALIDVGATTFASLRVSEVTHMPLRLRARSGTGRTPGRTRHVVAALAATITVAGGVAAAAAAASPARAAPQGPCDIYASGGTPCVAAHSTTRALYASYDGPLYQVRRASDNATTSIHPLSAGGVANAAAQDSFCAGTTCVITEIYDQSGRGNNLTDAPAGGAAGGPDNLANATAARVTVGGHRAYGVFVAPGTGYRDDNTSGIATGDQPEGEYAVLDGTHYNGGCCFDYGNAETNNDDNGAGHMEAIYFGDITVWGFGSGSGPWIMADMENGLFSGSNARLNSGDPSISHRFTTAMIEGEAGHWAILGGNANSGGVSTFYSGVRPSGYNPMHKEGAIILGIGGDNSKSSAGTFYEGVMTSGYPSAATESAVQANIVSAGYSAG